MPAERVAMRVVREVLRLMHSGVSKREVARRTGLASSTVRMTIARFQSLGLTWPLPETVTDSDLEARLYKNAGKKQGHRRSAEPDWAFLHRKMKRKHVTLSILWDEYIEAHPDGYTWLIQHYDDGDQVFIFGFSRGAYTARSLSGLISKCGVMKLGAPLSIERLYARYRTLPTMVRTKPPRARGLSPGSATWFLKRIQFFDPSSARLG